MSALDDQDPRALANRLGPALFGLMRQFRRHIHAGAGLPPAQAALLGMIVRHPGIGVSAIAAAEGSRPATVSIKIKPLEAAGLIARTPDAADRRRTGFAATEAGQRMAREIKRQWTAALAGRLAQLPPEGRIAIAAALPYLDRIGDQDGDAQ